MSALATIIVRETHGRARAREPVRIGVPLARAALKDAAACSLVDAAGQAVPAQFRSLGAWPDGSVQWLLVDAGVSVPANTEARLQLQALASTYTHPPLDIQQLPTGLRIDTGAAVFEIPKSGDGSIARVSVGGRAVLDSRGIRLRAAGKHRELVTRVDRAQLEEAGPFRATVLCQGALLDGAVEAARVALRLVLVRDSAALRIECEIWNSRAARHVGGLWDLGDAGSVNLRDLSFELRPGAPSTALEWQAAPGSWAATDHSDWTLYQDSSGGERWNSPNHVDARGKLTVSFRGYRVHDARGEVVAQGERATPIVKVSGASGSIAATVEKFWQNFPKALRWRAGNLEVGLFPAETAAGFELQGGEKKRHVVLLEFGDFAEPLAAIALHAPLEVALDPGEAAVTGAVKYLVPAAQDRNAGYLEYLASIVEGQHAFVAKRELIDEYGWRNFGDLYADHEAVNHQGSEPFVSHYNNQYDFVYGAAMHYLRTGENRWRTLMEEAARHLIDIDIYHTTEDKAGFSGGLFWHTDHYHPAATSTHRTYSRKNARGPYGGGPSNEQNYSSGLLQYFHLSGDPEAAAAIRTLADWVMAMDDGSLTLLGLIDDGPTGLASKTRDMNFHKPGRGAGNSINALLDAFSVTRERRYFDFAEQLVRRVIHPQDDFVAMGLDDPENRWSYLAFLQVLGKYLDRKLEWGETDYLFWYARAALLNYARWMLVAEQPYRDVLHKVELPTETWPAHDIRKCHVLHLAARYAPPQEQASLTSRASFFFERCIADLTSFPTCFLTRPQVILCVYGCVQAYYQNESRMASLPQEPHHDFGAPIEFATQSARIRSTLRRKLRVALAETSRLIKDRTRALFGRH